MVLVFEAPLNIIRFEKAWGLVGCFGVTIPPTSSTKFLMSLMYSKVIVFRHEVLVAGVFGRRWLVGDVTNANIFFIDLFYLRNYQLDRRP